MIFDCIVEGVRNRIAELSPFCVRINYLQFIVKTQTKFPEQMFRCSDKTRKFVREFLQFVLFIPFDTPKLENYRGKSILRLLNEQEI